MVEPGQQFSNFKLRRLLLKGVSYRSIYEAGEVTWFWGQAVGAWPLSHLFVSHTWALRLFLRVRGAGLKPLPEISWSL